MIQSSKIAFGGGCHWCTEAVFQSLIGVDKVEQGFIASTGEYQSFSEAVIVHFNQIQIPLKLLIEVHLHTHKSTSNHSLRHKYRSAIYTFSDEQNNEVKNMIDFFQKEFVQNIVTKVLPFSVFKASGEAYQNYYQNKPDKPFCETYINPKLRLLFKQFSVYTNAEKLNHLL